jgi:hypothetical protein
MRNIRRRLDVLERGLPQSPPPPSPLEQVSSLALKHSSAEFYAS